MLPSQIEKKEAWKKIAPNEKKANAGRHRSRSAPSKTIMSIRTSLRDYACSAMAVLAVFGSTPGLLAQQVTGSQADQPVDPALSSVEQGHTQLTDTFDFREFQLEKRRQAFKDTTFEINF